MAGKSPNIFSVIETLIKSVYKKLESRIGRINVLTGFIILLIALAFVLAPVAHYILLGIQTICNMVLILNNKETMPIDTSAPSMEQVTAWMIIIFVESLICAVIVYLSEQLKINLGVGSSSSKSKKG